MFEELDKEQPFIVLWSDYLQLMWIENEDERKFYEIEATNEAWGIRTLQRQYNSSLYERLALSREKDNANIYASEYKLYLLEMLSFDYLLKIFKI
ncbi:MAG: DUF1016 N-terminal domain-containing protein [Lachnospiraceae bacterium]|nr:DUF1016 N-terminal domain-containing protein [Lachnospiraceae bacterium]